MFLTPFVSIFLSFWRIFPKNEDYNIHFLTGFTANAAQLRTDEGYSTYKQALRKQFGIGGAHFSGAYAFSPLIKTHAFGLPILSQIIHRRTFTFHTTLVHTHTLQNIFY